MSNIVVYPGSCDPITNGHLVSISQPKHRLNIGEFEEIIVYCGYIVVIDFNDAQ